jgi:hypothetical protein
VGSRVGRMEWQREKFLTLPLIGARGSVVGGGTMLQAGRSRVDSR